MEPSGSDAGEPDADESMRAAALDAALAEVQQWGVDRFSIEGVAHRSHLSIEYLRQTWADERELIVEALLAYSEAMVPIPDTGSLRGDLTELALSVGRCLNEPVARRIARVMVIDSKSMAIDSSLRGQFWLQRRITIEAIFNRAAERGELKGDVRPTVAFQLLTSPLHTVALYSDRPVQPAYCRTIADLITRALSVDENSRGTRTEVLGTLHYSPRVQ